MTKPFATCDLCDLHESDTSGNFRVLAPVFRSYGGMRSFSGSVRTVQTLEDNSLVKALLEGPGNGQVLVVDGAASLRRALLGGNMGGAAARNGWAGVLIDGCVRDVAELQDLPIGILALASIPMRPDKRGYGQTDVPVRVQGTWIRPGDWLYADADGVVVSATALL